MAVVFPEYIVKKYNLSMYNFTVAIAKCSYMFWLDKVTIIKLYISEV